MRDWGAFVRAFLATGALAGFGGIDRPAAAPLAPVIGASVKVENQVTGTLAGWSRALNPGSDVFVNDLVRTSAASLAQITFVDATKLSLGPLTQVRLDRFVFNPARGARSVTLDVAHGAFRFVTGNSDARAFAIGTPTAVIGVRGTIFNARVARQETLVVLEEGEVIVCNRLRKRHCVRLVRPDQYVAVRADGSFDGPYGSGGSTIFNFGAFCTLASTICTTTKSELVPPPYGRFDTGKGGEHSPPASVPSNGSERRSGG